MPKVDDKLVNLRENFRNYYIENLHNDYQILDVKRKKYLKMFGKSLLIFILLFAVLGKLPRNGLTGFLIIIFLMVSCFVLSYPFFAYKSQTKQLVMPKIMSFLGNMKIISTSETEAIDTDLNQTKLFACFDKRETDDIFRGVYRSTLIHVAEEELEQRYGYGMYRYSCAATIFSGISIRLTLNKTLHGHTIVRSTGSVIGNFLRLNITNWVLLLLLLIILGLFIYPLFLTIIQSKNILDFIFSPGIFYVALLALSLYVLYLTIKPNMPEFYLPKKVDKELICSGEKWRIYSDNAYVVKRILTPVFMEKMLEIKRRFYGQKIELSILDNQIIIAVQTNKNMFETTSLLIPTFHYAKAQEIIEQFYCIFSLVDVLKNKKHRK